MHQPNDLQFACAVATLALFAVGFGLIAALAFMESRKPKRRRSRARRA